MPSLYDQFRQFANDFSERLLKDYTKLFLERGRRLKPKEFNDPVWNTIVLRPLEVAFVDSPLLQRLRLIRQLGVAHWVYPGATHTRFEHSLGAVHQVQNLIDAVNTRHEEQLINDRFRNILRLTALCHDIGHGLMSHVSENALRRFDEHEELLLELQDQFQSNRVKISEALAYFIIKSEPFHLLFRHAREFAGSPPFPENPLGLMADAVIGNLISDKFPLLHEFINGPFDADKLDYLPRDSYFAGVPAVIDIPRLVQKLRAVQVNQDDLPTRIAANVQEGQAAYWLFGIALSGGRTLDELMLGRTLLFDKIYRHQKVRAIEAMVAAVLDIVHDYGNTRFFELPFLLSDEELVQCDFVTRFSEGSHLDNGTANQTERKHGPWEARNLASRLRERRLFIRAFAYSHRMAFDPNRTDPTQKKGLSELSGLGSNALALRQFEETVARETFKIIRLLGEDGIDQEGLSIARSPETLIYYVKFDPASAASQAKDIYNAFLVTRGGQIVRFKDETAEARGWNDAYPLARDLGYVFAAEEIAPYVALATERIVRIDYGVQIPPDMWDYVNLSSRDLQGLKGKLAALEYYSDAPFDLRPVPPRLRKADVETRLSRVVSDFSGYRGPVLLEQDQEAPIPEAALNIFSLKKWLQQFEEGTLIEVGMGLLEKIRLVGRNDLVEPLTELLRLEPEFKSATLCPLGEPKDSSAVCTYLAGDVQQISNVRILSLDKALTSTQGPIIFIDDFIGSGKQAVTIMETLLGEALSHDLGEQRLMELSPTFTDELRKRPLAFVFAAGLAEGKVHFSERLVELGVDAEIIVGLQEEQIPRAFEGKLDTAEAKFKHRCQEIGEQLLRSDRPKKSDEWYQSRVLGYGNHGLLLVFPYNTPAQTLTCLWSSGQVEEVPWHPPFPRRRKI